MAKNNTNYTRRNDARSQVRCRHDVNNWCKLIADWLKLAQLYKLVAEWLGIRYGTFAIAIYLLRRYKNQQCLFAKSWITWAQLIFVNIQQRDPIKERPQSRSWSELFEVERVISRRNWRGKENLYVLLYMLWRNIRHFKTRFLLWKLYQFQNIKNISLALYFLNFPNFLKLRSSN